jgi:uncharacterized Tic20 family protein
MPSEPDFDDERPQPTHERVAWDYENRPVAVLVHLGGFFTWFLLPAILLATQTNRRSLVSWHAREALNFQITVTIYYMLALPLFFLVVIDEWLILVGLGVLGIVTLFELLVVILASIAAYNGQRYRCPLTFRFFSPPHDFHDSDDYENRE